MLKPLSLFGPTMVRPALRAATPEAAKVADQVELGTGTVAQPAQKSSARPEPTGSAVLYRATQNSGFERVLKVPYRFTGSRVQLLNPGPEPLYLLDGPTKMTAVDGEGKVTFAIDRPDKLRQSLQHPQGGLVLHSPTAVQLHDPASGKQLYSYQLDGEDSKVFAGSKSLILAQKDSLKFLDEQLQTTRELPTAFLPESATELKDGTVILSARQRVQVLNPEGRSVHDAEHDRFSQPQVVGDTLHLRGEDGAWTRVNLKSGASQTVNTGHRDYDLDILPDGQALGRYEHDKTRSTFRVYRPDGSVANAIDVEGAILKTIVSKDGKSAFVLSRRWMNEPKRQTLYRLDLTQERGSLVSGLGRLADRVGLKEEKETLFERQDDHSFRVAQLQTGELAVAADDGIYILNQDGKVRAQFGDVQEMVESRDSELWPLPTLGEQARTFEEELRGTESWSDYIDLAGVMQKRGCYRNNGALEFVDTRGNVEAYEEMGYSQQQMMDLVTRATLMPETRRRMNFPGPGFGTAEIVSDFEGDMVMVETRRQGEGRRTKLFLDDFSKATALLAMKAGDRHMVAVSDHYGSLYIFEHGESSRPAAHFRLENPIEGMTVNSAGKLLAFTGKGEILCWSADEKLSAGGHGNPVTEALLEDEIEFEENSIQVGDFDLERC